MPQNIKKWTNQEIEFINNNYKILSVNEIAEKLERSKKCVRAKIERLGIKLLELERTKAAIWTTEDIEFLKKNHLKLQDEERAEKLGKERGFNKQVVFRKRHSLKLSKKSERIRVDKDGYKYWINYNKRIYTHREKMETKLGRKLKPSEIVHHKDGNKKNDDLNNLYLCKNS